MGGDRQSTWEHMAPTNNKPCALHTETSGGQPWHTSRTVTGLFSSGLKMAAEHFTMKNVDGFIITGFDHLPNQKLIGFLILITYMLIFLGNSINLCIILTDRHLHKPMYILICNLAVVDKMFSSSCSITMRAMRAAG